MTPSNSGLASGEGSIIYMIDDILENQNDSEFKDNFSAIFRSMIDSNPQLKALPNLINTRNSSYINLLHCTTIVMNCYESTKYLLDNFSNITFTFKFGDGWSNPLTNAIGKGSKLEIIQILIDYIIKYNIEGNFFMDHPTVIFALFIFWINKQSIDYYSLLLIDKIIDTIISVSSIGHIMTKDSCDLYLTTITISLFHITLIDIILQKILTYIETLITNIKTLSSSEEDITLETLFEENNLLKKYFIEFFHSEVFKLMVTITSSNIAKELYTKLNLAFCFNHICNKLPKYNCACFNAQYCSKICQKSDRKVHKKYCCPIEKVPIDTIDMSNVENDK
jgi:ankyrin repeat protein